MIKPLVSVVIVTLNNVAWLGRSLKNLFGQDYKNIEVFVVDNGSSDNTISTIMKNFKKVRLIEAGENIGFGRAANMAIKKARGKYIFIYNDDAFLEKNTIDILVKHLEIDNSIGSIQGTVLFYNRKNIVESAGSFLTNTGVLEKREGFKYRDDLEESEVFSANLPIIRKKAIEKSGLFDEDYFLYFEDADLSWRIWLAGYRVIFCPEAKLYHVRGTTTRKTPKPSVLQSTYQNRIDSLIKNLSGASLIWMLPSNIAVSLTGVLIFLVKGKPKEAIAILVGTFAFLFNLPKILRKRQRVQSTRKISDFELFKRVFTVMNPRYLLKGAITYFRSW